MIVVVADASVLVGELRRNRRRCDGAAMTAAPTPPPAVTTCVRSRRLMLVSRLSEDREASLFSESIHPSLDRGFHFAIDGVDVIAIVDPLWVVVDVNRIE
jgi:hypothetical protein